MSHPCYIIVYSKENQIHRLQTQEGLREAISYNTKRQVPRVRLIFKLLISQIKPISIYKYDVRSLPPELIPTNKNRLILKRRLSPRTGISCDDLFKFQESVPEG